MGEGAEDGRGILWSLLRQAHPLDLLPPLVAFLLAARLAGAPMHGRSWTGLALLAAILLGGHCLRAGFGSESAANRDAGRRAVLMLRAGGWGLSLAGLAAAVWVGRDFWSMLAAIFLVGLAQSHPAIRWVERPIAGIVAAAARGFLSFDLGILASGADSSYGTDLRLIAGAAASIAVAVVSQRISRR